MKNLLLILLSSFFLLPSLANASGGGEAVPENEWSFSGMFGTYDKASMQRGLKVYREVCSACHSLQRVYFRNLEALGYNQGQIKALAAEYTVTDGPNGEGEMFERPARPSDKFPGPFANDEAAKYANNGAFPPDLSLITKARAHGADYIRALLIGYHAPPHGDELMEGQYWNTYMSGHVIAMAPPLSDDLVEYEDETPTTTEQYATDIAHFLTWAAEPEMEDRKRMGVKVMIFLLIFSGLMYLYKKRLWRDVH